MGAKELDSPFIPFSFKKTHSKTDEREKRPKFDRGRRACSENPPARTELIKFNLKKVIAEEVDQTE